MPRVLELAVIGTLAKRHARALKITIDLDGSDDRRKTTNPSRSSTRLRLVMRVPLFGFFSIDEELVRFGTRWRRSASRASGPNESSSPIHASGLPARLPALLDRIHVTYEPGTGGVGQPGPAPLLAAPVPWRSTDEASPALVLPADWVVRRL
jgi:hypothetical protein